MPRKKPIQPKSLQEFIIRDDDGNNIVVEVRDETCQIKGRGFHKRNTYEKKRDEVLVIVANEYLTPQGRKNIPPTKNYLASASKFSRKLTEKSFLSENGVDDSSIRKKLYKDIIKNIAALENAIRNKNYSE